MTVNRLVRQLHRWVSVAFVVGVLVYIVKMQAGKPPGWVGLFPLLPLILLFLTGVYLFALPYAYGHSKIGK